MARPKKNNAEYFSHDADMRNHRKVRAIRNKFGPDGYCVWCMMLETLTGSDFFQIEWGSQLDKELLAADFGVNCDRLEQIVEYLLQLGLLKCVNNFILSENLSERLNPVVEKRRRAKERAESGKQKSALWLGSKKEVFERDGYKCVNCGSTNDLEVDHVLPRSKGGTNDLDNLQTLCMACNASKSDKITPKLSQSVTVSTQSKVKESKVNSIVLIDTQDKKFKSPPIDDAKAFFQQRNASLSEAERFWNYYESNGWKVGRNKMKSWTHAAAGWISRINEQPIKLNGHGQKSNGLLTDAETAYSVYEQLKKEGY